MCEVGLDFIAAVMALISMLSDPHLLVPSTEFFPGTLVKNAVLDVG